MARHHPSSRAARPAHLRLRHLILLLGLAGPLAHAAVTLTGPYWTTPGGVVIAGASLLRPDVSVWMANAAPGSFAANAGSVVQLGSLSLGNNGGIATGLLSGAGTRLELHAGEGRVRLEVGNFGSAELTVADGAALDGRASAAACIAGQGWCGVSIGASAGSSGMLTVTDAGSIASFMGSFNVANINVNGGGYGTPGAQTTGDVSVLHGGVLNTERTLIGSSYTGPLGLGSERSIARALVQGEGSSWFVSADSRDNGGSFLDVASGSRARANLDVVAGALMQVQAAAGRDYGLRIGFGGFAEAGVAGAGSVLRLQGDADKGYFHIAEGGTAGLRVADGGRIEGGRSVQVGLTGGNGSLEITGLGSQALWSTGDVSVGNAAEGGLSVNAGGLLRARQLSLAMQQGEASLTLSGVGSRIELTGVDMHRFSAGHWGSAGAVVSAGAVLDASQDAAACAGHWCGALIGQSAGSTASFTITDAGSQASFLGDFNVGGVTVSRPPLEPWTEGTPGGVTNARVEVLNGGLLLTERVNVGGWASPSGSGGERSFSSLVIDGPGSTWRVSGSALANQDAFVSSGTHSGGQADWQIRNGGQLLIEAPAGRQAHLRLAHGGGRSEMLVSGGASQLRLAGTEASINVGESGGWARLRVSDGALVKLQGSDFSYLNLGQGEGSSGVLEILGGGRLEGAQAVNIGQGGQGEALIDGSGSRLDTQRSGGTSGQLIVGGNGPGRLELRNGGGASAFSLGVGNGWDLAGRGEVVLTGAGTQVDLVAVDWHRLGLERGSLLVSGGAVLNGRSNAADCTGHWCGVFLANNAGGDASLTVSGVGSRASFLSNLIAGGSYVTAPPDTPYTLGRAGAGSQVRIEVLDGGLLETEAVSLGYGPQGPARSGSESVSVALRLDGAGSLWRIQPGSPGSTNTGFSTGVNGGANSAVSIAVRNGARMELFAPAGGGVGMQLARDGGQTSMVVDGVGSALSFADGVTRTLVLGRAAGQAQLWVSHGGALSGMSNLAIGTAGGQGLLKLSDAGSRIDGSAASFAQASIGSGGGQGVAQLSGGGQWRIAAPQAVTLLVGSGSNGSGASTGQLTLQGAGSRLDLESGGWADASTTFNPQLSVGASGGSGQLTIAAGAVLALNGGNPSTPARAAYTQVNIGNGLGSSGNLLVQGSGARLELSGSDARLLVGINGGAGTAALRDGAAIAGTYLGVGVSNGGGILHMNASSIALSGQWGSQSLGPRLAIGAGSSGMGQVNLSAGSLLTLDNGGVGDGAALVLGGVTSTPLGSGTLMVNGGSRIDILSQPHEAAALIGQTGIGTADFSGASQLNVAGGGIFVARLPGSIGTLRLREGSSATASWVGVGAQPGGLAGGQGWLNVTSGGVLNAEVLDIGPQGTVSGSGTLNAAQIHLNGGVLRPGDSPGTLTLNGAFDAAAGSQLVLEIQGDGQHGFVTDQLIFGQGTAIDLGALQISFHFLGNTDPNAFQAGGGFQIGNFLMQQQGAGGLQGLDAGLFQQVSFSASADAYHFESFSFNAAGGAVFSAQPVPEPATWGMLLLGLMFTLRRLPRPARR